MTVTNKALALCGFAEGFSKAKHATAHCRISVTGRSYCLQRERHLVRSWFFVHSDFQSSAADCINCSPLMECEWEAVESS